MSCYQCEKPMSRWTDVTFDVGGRLFCSLLCVYRHRGKEKLA